MRRQNKWNKVGLPLAITLFAKSMIPADRDTQVRASENKVIRLKILMKPFGEVIRSVRNGEKVNHPHTK